MSCRYKLILAFLSFLMPATAINAQGNVIHAILSRLQSHQSISYDYVYKQKDFTDDTLIQEHHDVLYKMPEDRQLGYYFANQQKDRGAKDGVLYIYNGKGLFSCNLADNSY